MGNSKKPHQDDQDNDGIPDNGPGQSQVHSGQDLDGDGVEELVNHRYRYVGGSDLANSTSLDGSTANVLGGVVVDTPFAFGLPAETDAAYEVVVGVCHGLPVATGN